MDYTIEQKVWTVIWYGIHGSPGQVQIEYRKKFGRHARTPSNQLIYNWWDKMFATGSVSIWTCQFLTISTSQCLILTLSISILTTINEITSNPFFAKFSFFSLKFQCFFNLIFHRKNKKFYKACLVLFVCPSTWLPFKKKNGASAP